MSEAPQGDAMARLLAERWPVQDDETLSVTTDEAARSVEVVLRGPRHRYRINVRFEGGPERLDPWTVLVDAVDALFGQLIENDRAHRALPAGSGVEFGGATFDVTVEHSVPELDKLADRLLAQSDDPN